MFRSCSGSAQAACKDDRRLWGPLAEARIREQDGLKVGQRKAEPRTPTRNQGSPQELLSSDFVRVGQGRRMKERAKVSRENMVVVTPRPMLPAGDGLGGLPSTFESSGT